MDETAEDINGGNEGEYAAALFSSNLQISNTLSDTSSDEDNRQMQFKLEHMKALVHQLQRELHSERVKNQGQISITNSLKETKTDNGKLRQQLLTKEKAIAILQNRLAQVGENTEVTLQEGEIVIPGPSKQVLDSLTEENCKLKQSLRYMAVDPSHVEQLQKALDVKEKELLEVKKNVQDLTQSDIHLKELLHSSENVKDKKIMILKQKINDLEQNKDTQNVLCQSLCDETENLRGKLKEMAEQCNKLERNLSLASGVRSSVHAPFMKTTTDTSSPTMAQSPTLINFAAENNHLKAELANKAKELQKVIEMNARWQKYNDQREEYVKKLHKSLTETEDKLAKSRNVDGISEEQQAEIDRIILQCKRKIEIVEEDKQKIEDENRVLVLKVHNLKDENKEKEQEVTNLKEQIQTMFTQQQQHHTSVSDRERIQILEHQIKICTDDFQQERKDREQAMSRVAQLENELDFHRRQLSQYQENKMADLAHRRTQALNNYQRQYYQMHPSGGQSGGMVARGAPIYQADCSDDEGEDVIDGPPAVIQRSRSEIGMPVSSRNRMYEQSESIFSKPKTVPGNFFSSSHKSDFVDNIVADSADLSPQQSDTLQCPKCHLQFPSNKHFDLLDHINDCC